MSRDVGNNPAPKDDDLDYTTEAQAMIDDVYALVVKREGEIDYFQYFIEDLEIDTKKHGTTDQKPYIDNNYYSWDLVGTMKPTSGTEEVKIILLTNLENNNIEKKDGNAISSLRLYFETLEEGTTKMEDIYDNLIYNYNGTTRSITENKIPMWGETAFTSVPASEDIELTCYLYRALAKVQIWVNMKDGIDGFVINSITVNNIHTKGYCVSQANFDDDSPHYTGTNGFKPYVAPYPYIPANEEEYSYQSVTYNSIPTEDGKTKFFSDMIYLPEQVNKGATEPVTITVNYTYNTVTQDGIIRFTEGGVEDQSKAFDIIRNHSYIFNINKKTTEDVEFSLYYQVVDFTNIENGTLNFGNGDGNVTNGNTVQNQ